MYEEAQINPWTWQDQRGFSRAGKSMKLNVIFVSGRVRASADGQPMHPNCSRDRNRHRQQWA
jgi:hypothetical protein